MSNTRFPFISFPKGWFFIARSEEIAKEKVISIKIFNQEIVIFRTQSGLLSVIDAYCPHLGAHLGYGGQVKGESIRCPFHGFCFSANGDCTATGCGGPPTKKLSIKTWTVYEVRGLIFIWHDEEGSPPSWQIPHLETEGWSPYLSRSWVLRTHPQEIQENGVDTSHFTAVHGLENVEVLKKASAHNHIFHTRYAANGRGLRGKTSPFTRVEFDINMYGIGYVFVNMTIPDYGLDFHQMTLITPVDHEYVKLTAIVSITQMNFQKIHPFLKFVPKNVIGRILLKMTFNRFVKDIVEDFKIWENKKYLNTPRLVAGDGPIAKYRQWAKQFYKQQTDTFSL